MSKCSKQKFPASKKEILIGCRTKWDSNDEDGNNNNQTILHFFTLLKNLVNMLFFLLGLSKIKATFFLSWWQHSAVAMLLFLNQFEFKA